MSTSRAEYRARHAGVLPSSVLFVCQGNIARSAAAELMARAAQRPGDGLEFVSAGVGAVVGAGVADTVAAQLSARGVDPQGHRAQQLDRDLLESSDLVLCMQDWHRTHILEEWPGAVRRVFLLGQAARLLPAVPPEDHRGDAAAWLRAHGGSATAADQIEDPYRRGEEAARVAVDRIQQCLDALVPALQAWRQRA